MIPEVMTWLREQVADTDRSIGEHDPHGLRALCQAHIEIVDRHKPVQLDRPYHDGYSCEGCGADMWWSPGGLCPDLLSLLRAYQHRPGYPLM